MTKFANKSFSVVQGLPRDNWARTFKKCPDCKESLASFKEGLELTCLGCGFTVDAPPVPK